MPRICVDNNSSSAIPDTLDNLEAILQDVRQSLPPNRLVTSIVVDGKSFSPHTKLDHPLKDLGKIDLVDVKTGDIAVWRANGFDMALSCIEQTQKSFIRTAQLFRDENLGFASRLFSQCIDALEKFIETLIITRMATKIDFNQIQVENRTLSAVEDELLQILQAILTCQQDGDFEGIAERIEYELLANLSTWIRALTSINQSRQSNA